MTFGPESESFHWKFAPESFLGGSAVKPSWIQISHGCAFAYKHGKLQLCMRTDANILRSGPGKTNQRKVSSSTFRRGIPELKFNVNRACFPKGEHQNSQKWAKFMNFSFWPFLWFGLPGRLLIYRIHWAKIEFGQLQTVVTAPVQNWTLESKENLQKSKDCLSLPNPRNLNHKLRNHP